MEPPAPLSTSPKALAALLAACAAAVPLAGCTDSPCTGVTALFDIDVVFAELPVTDARLADFATALNNSPALGAILQGIEVNGTHRTASYSVFSEAPADLPGTTGSGLLSLNWTEGSNTSRSSLVYGARTRVGAGDRDARGMDLEAFVRARGGEVVQLLGAQFGSAALRTTAVIHDQRGCPI